MTVAGTASIRLVDGVPYVNVDELVVALRARALSYDELGISSMATLMRFDASKLAEGAMQARLDEMIRDAR